MILSAEELPDRKITKIVQTQLGKASPPFKEID